MHDETPQEKSDCLPWVQAAGFPKGLCPRCGWPTAPQAYHSYGECISPPRTENPLTPPVAFLRQGHSPFGELYVFCGPCVGLQSGTDTSAALGGNAAPSTIEPTSDSPTVRAEGPSQLSAALLPDIGIRDEDSEEGLEPYRALVLDMVKQRHRVPVAECNLQPILNPHDLKHIPESWSDPDEHSPLCGCKFCTALRAALHQEQGQPLAGGISKAIMEEACRLMPEVAARLAEAESKLVYPVRTPKEGTSDE
jgi:hypothetical protein